MYQRIVYLIKHNKFLRIMICNSVSFILRIIGVFIPTDKNMILFVSNIGKSYSGSPKEIYEAMRSDEKYKGYTYVWAFQKPDGYKDIGAKVIRFDTMQYFIYALKSGYWITDVNIERSLKFKKKKTKYMNTWHGIPLKKIGNDDKNSGTYDYSNIDYLCVSGEYEKKVFKTALNASDTAFLESGMPRNDELYYANEEIKEKYREELNIPKEKKIILYAPTWRDSTNLGKSYDLKIPVDFNKWEKYLGEEYVVLFRAHDRTTKIMQIRFNDFIRNVSDFNSLNKLLIISDILVSDYSSIVFDYSILLKPFICFAYDYENYLVERGMYFNAHDKYPGGILKTENELLNAIKNIKYEEEIRKVEQFRREFIQYGIDGKATETCIKAMFG